MSRLNSTVCAPNGPLANTTTSAVTRPFPTLQAMLRILQLRRGLDARCGAVNLGRSRLSGGLSERTAQFYILDSRMANAGASPQTLSGTT
jgi:hypothetical protein